MAIEKVHWSKGFFNTNGGFEYNLLLLAGAVAFGLAGSGPYGLDALLGIPRLPAAFVLLVAAGFAVAFFGSRPAR